VAVAANYTKIAVMAIVGSIGIGALISVFETQAVAETSVFGVDLGVRTGIAFLFGAACSMASGIIGMYISVKSNLRTTAAARKGVVKAVQVAMRGGAVSGFLVVALSLLGVYAVFVAFGGLTNPSEAPFLIVGYGDTQETDKEYPYCSGYWILRSTWGTGWGDQGHIKLCIGRNRDFDYIGTCNLLVYPNFPDLGFMPPINPTN